MSNETENSAPLRISRLNNRRPQAFDLTIGPKDRADIAQALGLVELRKLRFAGELRPHGKEDWELVGDLGATVVQPCVVSLSPVVTRIDEPVARLFVRDWQRHVPAGDEVEMPEDDTVDPLGETINLLAIARESLALALPLYPRADSVHLGQTRFAPPGAEDLSDEKIHPFAALQGLRQKMNDTPDDSA